MREYQKYIHKQPQISLLIKYYSFLSINNHQSLIREKLLILENVRELPKSSSF